MFKLSDRLDANRETLNTLSHGAWRFTRYGQIGPRVLDPNPGGSGVSLVCNMRHVQMYDVLNGALIILS